MTGDLAPFGKELKSGAQQAVDDLNDDGGVLGKQVRLVVGDDQCDPPRAVRVASDLVEDGVVFVAGHFCSGSSIPASAIYAEEGIVQITPASTNPRLTEDAAARGINTLFRTVGRDDRQGTFAGAWLANTYAGKNVAILDDTSPYGRGVADEVRKAMEADGLKPALRDTMVQKQKDYSPLIAALKGAQIDAVYIGGYHDDVAVLVRQAREQGFTGVIASDDALNTNEFWRLAGSAGEGVRYTDAASISHLPDAKDVVSRIRAHGSEPEGYALTGYAAVQAWAAGVAIAQSTDAEKVAQALHASTIPSVVGDLTWDAKGDLTHPRYAWYVWHRGQASEEP
jgi:branched-chain amino acid transport system substrate-binding protein